MIFPKRKIVKNEDGQVIQEESDPFVWLRFVHNLVDGDITKIDEAFKMNYIFCLNIESMRRFDAQKQEK